MATKIQLVGDIRITGVNNEIFIIEQSDLDRFYITSTNGYNGYEGSGFKSLVSAINHVNKMIANYYHDRCIENEAK
jgi:hypothetical protein